MRDSGAMRPDLRARFSSALSSIAGEDRGGWIGREDRRDRDSVTFLKEVTL
jgi:hypothetical protein